MQASSTWLSLAGEHPPVRPGPLRRATLLFGVGALYFASARLGVSLAYHGEDASLVWPAVGVAVAGMLLFGYGAAAPIFAAALLSGLWSGAAPLSAAVIAAGNTAGPLLGVALLRRRSFDAGLATPRDVAALTLVAGGAASLVSATVGAGWLALRGRYAPGTELVHWGVWMGGDMAGMVTTAPFLLVWSRWPSWARSPVRVAEFLMLITAAVVVAVVAFRITGPATITYPLSYVVFPFAAWAAVRFEQQGATMLSVLLIVIAIWRTVAENGPFAGPTLQLPLIHLHAFVVVVGASSLALAAVVGERRRLIAEQRDALRSERDSRMEAQRAVAARDKLLAVVSHEVRNPLASVLLNSTLVLDSRVNREMSPWVRDALDSIILATEQIEHVIRDLTEMTRLEAGQLSLERSPQPAGELVSQVAQMLGPLAASRELRLETELAPDLPPVLINRDRVLQVFSNLLGNAIRLTPAGGCVRVEGHADDGFVRFVVRDNGPGFTSEQAADLLRPYWDSPLRITTGHGFGIPIARAIVGAHGGRFHIDSPPEGGARVEFTLPTGEPAAA